MIPDDLRAWRARLGISQAEAAARLDTPKKTLEGWEQGRREPPPCLALLLRYVEKYGPLA